MDEFFIGQEERIKLENGLVNLRDRRTSLGMQVETLLEKGVGTFGDW
jgi:hypothetical protein